MALKQRFFLLVFLIPVAALYLKRAIDQNLLQYVGYLLLFFSFMSLLTVIQIKLIPPGHILSFKPLPGLRKYTADKNTRYLATRYFILSVIFLICGLFFILRG